MTQASYHCNEPANELEVLEVVGVDGGRGVNLQAVVVFAGIFKQTVHGVQDLVGEQEEPFPMTETHNITVRVHIHQLKSSLPVLYVIYLATPP